MIVVVCGARKTEKQYFSGLRGHCRNRAVKVELEEHFEKYRNYAEVERRLRRHLPRYDKTLLVFADYSDGVDAAVYRARARCDHEEEHLCNPSAGVWPLVEAMRPSRLG